LDNTVEDALRWFLKRELTEERYKLERANMGEGPDGTIVDFESPEQIEVQRLLGALEAMQPTLEELSDITCPVCGKDMDYREHSYDDDYSEYREHYSCTCTSPNQSRRITFKIARNELES